MYAPKFGFNTPFHDWVNSQSEKITQFVNEGELVNQQVLSQKSLENFSLLSTEMQWSLYHLEMFLRLYGNKTA